MKYSELKRVFCDWNRDHPTQGLTAHIIFTEDSFDNEYSLLSRTYRITSDEKAFWPSMAGYSVFGDCLDGTDQGVRLDYYMQKERANVNGWKVEDCYILEYMRDAAMILNAQRQMQDDGSICYFFGDTAIRVAETTEDSRLCLKPIAGDQTACGEWTDLPVDRVHGYCFLLEKSLNGGEKR